jgi:hypothetical protein
MQVPGNTGAARYRRVGRRLHDQHKPTMGCASSWLSELPSGAPHAGGAFSTGGSLAALFGRVKFSANGPPYSIFLRPFAPPALPGFDATMDALTPARRFVTALSTQVSLLRGPHLPTLPSPTTRRRPGILVWFSHPGLPSVAPPQWSAASFQEPCVTWVSPLGCRLTTTTGRNAFVILRTSRSPPVALHLASRQRSYVRLRGSDQPRRGLAPRGCRILASAHPCRLVRQVNEF